MRIKKAITTLTICSEFALFCACGNGEPEIVCKTFDISGCKEKVEMKKEQKDTSSTSFHWVKNGNLEVKRYNVAVDCQSKELVPKVEIKHDNIIVTEEFSKQGNECLCSKDLKFEISNIPSGDYNMIVNGRNLGKIRIY